jgi:putative MATE family efflux protein
MIIREWDRCFTVTEERNKFKLSMLAWPIFIELFLQLMLGAVDTLMVSKISDDAVAVVGFSNQIFTAFMTLFMVISSGSGILIAQKLGAREEKDARTIAIISIKVSAIIGVVISIILAMMPLQIVKVLHLPTELYPLAKIYITIVGGGMILTALMTALSTIIRNTGNTKATMYTAMGMNVVHLFLNYGFIFGAFGFPQLGLTGVAVSTVVSRLLALLMLFFILKGSFAQSIRLPDFRLFDKKLFKAILRIGWPMGVNMSCWFLTQLLIFSFIAMIGAKELAARTYMNTLESFCFMLGFSIAAAVQIQIAHMFGAGRVKEAYRAAYRALGVGLLLVTINALLLYYFGVHVLQLFTKDPAILELASSLFVLNLVLQPGKMLNMALGNALSAIGDTRYIMITAVFSMWLIAAMLSYWVGVHLGYGLIGIYLCMICDEYVRGLLAFIRWRGKRYLRLAEQREEAAKSHDLKVSDSVSY